MGLLNLVRLGRVAGVKTNLQDFQGSLIVGGSHEPDSVEQAGIPTIVFLIPPRAKPSSELFARVSLSVTLQNKGFGEIPSPARCLKSLPTGRGILRAV